MSTQLSMSYIGSIGKEALAKRRAKHAAPSKLDQCRPNSVSMSYIGSIGNEALENEDLSTQHPRNSKTMHPNSKTMHPNSKTKHPTRKRCVLLGLRGLFFLRTKASFRKAKPRQKGAKLVPRAVLFGEQPT